MCKREKCVGKRITDEGTGNIKKQNLLLFIFSFSALSQH